MDISVKKLSEILKIDPNALLEKMIAAGLSQTNLDDLVSTEDKQKLLSYIRSAKDSPVSEKKVEVPKELDSLEKIVDLDATSISAIFGEEKRTTEVLDKANELLLQDAFNADFSDPTMEDSLVNLSGITNDILSSLSANKIKKLDELAEMSVGELMDLSDKITETEASALIMEARKPWFE